MGAGGNRRRGVLQTLKDVLYGMTGYELERTARELRAQTADLFALIVFGDLIGLPIIPSYYALRLLPYFVPEIEGWKRRMLREKDLTEVGELHLH